MSAEAFFKSVLPSDKVVATTISSGGVVNRLTTTADVISQAPNVGVDYYFASAEFSSNERKDEHLVSRKCLVLDIDIKANNPKHFADQREALAAARVWWTTSFVEPTWIVNSGYGWHVYWSLVTPVSREVARTIADAFVSYTQASADPRLISDASTSKRIGGLFRVPGSTNFKHGGTRRVTAFQLSAKEYTAEELLDATRASVETAQYQTPVTTTTLPFSTSEYGTSAVNPSAMFVDEGRPIDISFLLRNCAIVADMGMYQDRVSEPAWKALANLLTFVEDKTVARNIFHKMSKDHPGYVPQNTDAKFSYALKTFSDPATRPRNAVKCQSLRDMHCGGKTDMCTACPIFNKNAPHEGGVLSAGRTMPKVKATTLTRESLGVFTFISPADSPRPWSLTRSAALNNQFYADADGHLRLFTGEHETSSGRKVKATDVVVCTNAFYFDRRLLWENGTLHGQLLAVEKIGEPTPAQALMDVESSIDSDKILKLLVTHGAEVKTRHISHIKDYIDGERSRVRNMTEQMDMGMAWSDTRYTRFALGNFVVDKKNPRNHVEKKSRFVIDNIQVQNRMKLGPNPETLAPDAALKDFVKRVIEPLANPNTTDAGRFVLLSGLGAPLACMTSNPGLDVWMGGAPGSGKSEMLKIIMSFTGDPIKGTHISDRDSVAGANAVRGVLRHLPVCYDEATNNDADHIYKTSMASTGNAGNKSLRDGHLDTNRAEFSNSTFSTSNRHPFENLDLTLAEHQATLTRKVMVDFPRSGGFIVDYGPDYHLTRASRDTNFGWIGLDFIAWSVWDNEDVKQRVRSLNDMLMKTAPSTMRFKYSALACAIMAVQYLHDRVGVDLRSHIKGMKTFIDGTATVVEHTTTSSVLLTQFSERIKDIVQYALASGERHFPKARGVGGMFGTSSVASYGSVIIDDLGKPVEVQVFRSAIISLAVGMYNDNRRATVLERALTALHGQPKPNNIMQDVWSISL